MVGFLCATVRSKPRPRERVIGAQVWGDEGKGKVIDILAEYFDVIARVSGAPMRGTRLS